MNLERLQIFLKIVETGSMSAAARSVHLTQPALSRSLGLFEEELQTVLFQRKGRGLVLTPAGRALVPRARALLSEVAGVAREIGRFADRSYFDVRIGTIDSVATFLLPDILRELKEVFPELSFKLSVARTAQILSKLYSGDLDLGIVAYSGPPGEVASKCVGPYHLEYYGRKDKYPSLRNVSGVSELRSFPIVEIEPPPGQPSMIPEGAYSYAVATTIASVKALILSGFGVGDLVGFSLTPAERKLLVKAQIRHDPRCGLHVARSHQWSAPIELKIFAALGAGLERMLA